MDLPELRSTEIVINTAETVGALAKFNADMATSLPDILSRFSYGTGLSQSIQSLSADLALYEQRIAEGTHETLRTMIDMYQRNCERRYSSRRLIRWLTLGLSSQMDADDAAEGAHRDFSRVLTEVEGMLSRQHLAVTAARLQFIQLLVSNTKGVPNALTHMMQPMQIPATIPTPRSSRSNGSARQRSEWSDEPEFFEGEY